MGYKDRKSIDFLKHVYFNILIFPKGNILYSNEFGEKLYLYQNQQRPQQVTQTSDETITYDSFGNVLSTNAYQIKWNSFNKADTLNITASNSTIQFQYGPDRERISKLTSNANSATLIHYISNVYEKWQQTVNGSVIKTTEKYYIKALNKIIATKIVNYQQQQRPASNLFYLNIDAFGNVDTVNDDRGNLLVKYNYSTFGRRQTVYSNVSGNAAMLELFNLGFSQNEVIGDERLIFFENRIYDTVLSRFISPDPYITDPFNTQSLNRYSYSLNNPFKFNDPSGLSWNWFRNLFIPIIAIVATAIVTIATAGRK